MNKTEMMHGALHRLHLGHRRRIRPEQPQAILATPRVVEPSYAEEKVRRSLRLATLEAIPGRIALAVSDNFMVPFGLLLRATSMQVAMLSTLPHLLAAMSQLGAPAIIGRLGSRKRVLQISGALGWAVWLAAMTVPLMPSGVRVWALIGFAVLSVALFNLPNPAWASWISAMVPVSNRGRYLGLRSIVASGAALVVFLGGGVFLDSLKERAILGFITLFGIAAVSRLISALIFSRVYEPERSEPNVRTHNLFQFLRELPHSNLGHFLMYSFALNFGVMIAGPFFAVYQLRDLQFSYTAYLGLAVGSTIATMVGLRLWGPFSDRFGNLKVVRISSVGVAIVPTLWLWVNDPLDAMLLSVFGGMAWAGMGLCAVNFIYECSNDQNRAQNVAYYYAFSGVAIFLGGLAGGFLIDYLPPIKGTPILTMFLISGALRLLPSILFLPFVSEVRELGARSRPGEANA